jgi:hypothetical protein
MAQTAISIERSMSGSGVDALRRVLARFGIRVSIDPYAVALAAISLIVLAPMIQPGYFWGAHDGRHAVYFLFEFDRVFTDGVLYPRWFPDMTYGYGYPLFNIYGPLAFYAGEIFHLIGIDFVTCVKLVFALAWVLSGLAMYGFVKRVFQNRDAAFIAGLLFVFMPYHLIDVYVRAAFAESVALVFLPLTLWGFYETVHSRNIRSVLFAGFAYAGMVFAHDGIALLFSIVLGAWMVFLILREVRLPPLRKRDALIAWVRKTIPVCIPTVAGLALGLGLTGIFLLPLVAEYKYINVAQWTQNYYDYQDHFVELYQLFSPFWGFGISVLGPVDGLSFQLGLVPYILGGFALFAIAKNKNKTRAFVLFFLALTLVIIALMFDFSLPAWKAFGLASVAQFPWRFLTLTTASLAALGGAVMLLSNREETKTFSLNLPLLALGALIVLGSFPYITDQNIINPREGPVGLAGLMRFENSANEMTGSTVYADQQPTWSPLADNYLHGQPVRSKVDFSSVPNDVFIRTGTGANGLRTTSERADYNAPNGDATIVFNVQMYPGWHAYLTESRSTKIVQELPISINPPFGRIQVTLPQGEHGVWLRFEDTPSRTMGTIVSGVSLLIAMALLVWDIRASRAASG